MSMFLSNMKSILIKTVAGSHGFNPVIVSQLSSANNDRSKTHLFSI